VQPGPRPVHVSVSGKLLLLGVADWHRPATGGGNFQELAGAAARGTTAAAAADARLDLGLRLFGESGGKLVTKSTSGRGARQRGPGCTV
jgi:hypothetical protein